MSLLDVAIVGFAAVVPITYALDHMIAVIRHRKRRRKEPSNV